MSDIQRYTLHPDGTELDDEGDWMYYADHLAAVAAADATLKRAENAWREEIRTRLTEQYEAGVKAARDAVAYLQEVRQMGGLKYALAAIDKVVKP